jgi:hypothetical protein
MTLIREARRRLYCALLCLVYGVAE